MVVSDKRLGYFLAWCVIKLDLVFTAGSLGCVRTAGLVYAKLGGKLKENELWTANGVLQTANEKASQEANVVFVEPRRLSLCGSILI